MTQRKQQSTAKHRKAKHRTAKQQNKSKNKAQYSITHRSTEK